MTAQDRQIGAPHHELSQQKRQTHEPGEQVQMQSLALTAEKCRGVRERIQGCCQQILATPMGQRFVHLLHEGLVADICKSPALMELLARLFERVMEE